ncbi:GNAT family N-acetyltransferase [Patulibacter defluvii]|uniref:GNAT family N-acetyltransferase n=1 Tax=Patulibacter defluvii TaxID=3095358 RepID=UPI002A751BB3|nr:GNAT family N-acetyltransferase [Patulibacter sp. DM4]
MRPGGQRSDQWWCQLIVGHGAGAVRQRAAAAERTPWGWMLTTPAVPRVWAVNRAQVVPRAGDLAADEVVAGIDAAHRAAGLAHRAVDLRSLADAERMQEALVAADLVPLSLEVLTVDPVELRERTAVAPAAEPAVTVAAEPAEAAIPVRATAAGDGDEEERRQVTAQWSLAPARHVTHLLARDADGQPLGGVVVHLASLHVEVDDLVTAAGHRGRGVGTALLAAVAELAVARDVGRVGLLADPADRPAAWYRRLGFLPVGRTVQAIRP